MITGYIGDVGSGKTLNMVYDLIEVMKWGRRVVSNTPIKFEWHGRKFEAEFIRNSNDFKNAMIYEQKCTLAIDEASVFLSSVHWNKIPPEIIAKFAQSRHFGMDMVYTSQGWGHTVKRLRDLTNEVFVCKRKRFMGLRGLPVFPFLYRKWNNKYQRKQWAIKRVSALSFEAKNVYPSYLKSTATSRKRLQPLIKYTRMLRPAHARLIFPTYNTLWNVEGSALVKMRSITDPNFKNTYKQEKEKDIHSGGIGEIPLPEKNPVNQDLSN